MKKLIVIFGGAGVEHDVSIVTGLQAIDRLKNMWEIIPVYFSLDNKFYITKYLKPSDYKNKEIVKKCVEVAFFNGGLYKVKNKKLKFLSNFDGVLNCCHGSVGENGTLFNYFAINKIKISSADGLSSGICMNKNFTKILLKSIDIPVVEGELVTGENYERKLTEIKKKPWGNFIVKPNDMGSSIGVVKSNKSNLKDNVEKVLHISSEVLIENCVENLVELNCAIMRNGNDLCVSQIEKVGTNKVLSFENKYCDTEIKREIPAVIDDKTKDLIYEYSIKAYSFLKLNGVVRIDYLFNQKTKELFLNEINTVPGSLAYYLFEGLGIDYTMLVETLLENSVDTKKQTYFESDILSKTGLKIK